MKIKPIVKPKRSATGWFVEFTIDNQTFSLRDVETKQHAFWYSKMLRIAFKKLQPST